MKRRGAIPFGWQLAADGLDLVEHDIEQCVIADVLGRRAAGESIRGIADALGRLGVVGRAGRPLRPTQVARILRRASRGAA